MRRYTDVDARISKVTAVDLRLFDFLQLSVQAGANLSDPAYILQPLRKAWARLRVVL